MEIPRFLVGEDRDSWAFKSFGPRDVDYFQEMISHYTNNANGTVNVEDSIILSQTKEGSKKSEREQRRQEKRDEIKRRKKRASTLRKEAMQKLQTSVSK